MSFTDNTPHGPDGSMDLCRRPKDEKRGTAKPSRGAAQRAYAQSLSPESNARRLHALLRILFQVWTSQGRPACLSSEAASDLTFTATHPP